MLELIRSRRKSYLPVHSSTDKHLSLSCSQRAHISQQYIDCPLPLPSAQWLLQDSEPLRSDVNPEQRPGLSWYLIVLVSYWSSQFARVVLCEESRLTKGKVVFDILRCLLRFRVGPCHIFYQSPLTATLWYDDVPFQGHFVDKLESEKMDISRMESGGNCRHRQMLDRSSNSREGRRDELHKHFLPLSPRRLPSPLSCHLPMQLHVSL